MKSLLEKVATALDSGKLRVKTRYSSVECKRAGPTQVAPAGWRIPLSARGYDSLYVTSNNTQFFKGIHE
jgi:hypothetical protein